MIATLKPRIPKNPSEKLCYERLVAGGWQVTTKGWPDFACFKGGKLVLIEVKPKRGHRLKRWQHRLLDALSKAGIQCYRWSPDGGFEKIAPAPLGTHDI